MLEEAGTSPGTGEGTNAAAPPSADGPDGDPGGFRRRGILLALGAAVLVMVVAAVAVGFTRGVGIGGVSSPPASAPGPTLGTRPAATDFAPLRSASQPPADVMDALVVPASATATGTTNYDRGSGPYDRGVSFTAPAPSDQVLNFFRFELAANQWSARTEAPARGGPGRQVLARHKSNDGFYWEVGVTVRRPAGQPTSSGGPTSFDVRLLQMTEG